YVMCQSGLRSYISCRILSGEGFDCYNFSGGYRFYENVMRETNLIESSLPCGMDKNLGRDEKTLIYAERGTKVRL
ncbi:MAG: hypothetical protein PUA56_00845, partial [Bacillales bacterium]|nr:hypothetical protein [Bacillales bacterium]